MKTLDLSPENKKLTKLRAYLESLTAIQLQSLGLDQLESLRIGSYSSLPGITCKGASECRAHVKRDRKTGKRTIVDGKDAIYRCFAASMAAQYPQTFAQWDRNTKALRRCKTPAQFADLFIASIADSKYSIVRAHVSGDCESEAQAAGLMIAAAEMPKKVIYGYTKSVEDYQAQAHLKTDNFRLSASLGGRFDLCAHENGWRTAGVVGSENQTTNPTDTNDLLALEPNVGAFGGTNFDLVIHGTQKPETWGSRALIDLRRGRA